MGNRIGKKLRIRSPRPTETKYYVKKVTRLTEPCLAVTQPKDYNGLAYYPPFTVTVLVSTTLNASLRCFKEQEQNINLKHKTLTQQKLRDLLEKFSIE